MADFPHLPLFTDAYLADTRHLSAEEHGAYLLLLMEAWRRPECSLPDDDRLLSRLCGLSVERWSEIKAVVMGFWQRDGRRKTWTQKRLIKERNFVAQKSASQRDKAAKRWKKDKNDDAAAMPDGCPTDAPTPTPTPTPSSLRSEEPQTPDLGLIGGEGESAKKGKEPDRFDEFWQAFPSGRKTDKPKAREVFGRIVAGKHKQIPQTDADLIILAVKRYAASQPDPQFTPMPATWLNGARWDQWKEPQRRPEPYRYVQGGIVR